MKVLKVVATVVAVVASVALIATGFGAPLGAGLLGVTWGTIAMTAGLVAAVAGALSKPKGTAIGSQTETQLNPQAGIPYLIGTTLFAGILVHQDTFGGSTNPYIGSVIVYSGGGPISAINSWQVDKATVTFSGGAATGDYADFMWIDTQLGDCPESTALVSSEGSLPGWGSSYKLSGLAAALWTLKFDKKGKKFAAGYPQTAGVFNGVKAYDPRLDSTYPGGSGAHRDDDETTWAFTENPALHGIAWALGRHQNGERVLGVGMPAEGIDLARWVEFANLCDANNWKCGGVVSSLDDKWEVLKNICQAGGGQPIRLGGLLSVDFQTPRVSLATITSSDLVGDAKVARTRKRRERINTIVPRFRSPGHGWEIISADPVPVADFVTMDGASRTREMDYALVQDLDQVAELAAYDIWSTREYPVGPLPLATIWMGYKPGDCVTVDVPELLPDATDIVITRRALDPQSLAVTLEGVSETGDKHDIPGATTTTAPPEPDLTPGDFPTIDAYEQSLIASSFTVPTTIGAATATSITISSHVRRYLDGDVSVTGTTLTADADSNPIVAETTYGLAYDDSARAGGAVTWAAYPAATRGEDAYPSSANPDRHFSGFITTDITGGTGVTGGGAYGPGATIGGEIIP